MNMPEYRNWRLEQDLDKVCWLTIDRAGETSNSLSREVLTELEQIVTDLEAHPPRGLVLQSGKKGSFIVGADVREFDQVSNPDEAEAFIREAHALFDRIEALPFPKVVAIDGYCLG
ncbi:MAG: enoyl-CoA hydratase/isomerase family protein, partial [Lysobacterales bacterium]